MIFAKKEQAILESLDVEREFTQIELGAVVVTEQQVFYISSSLEGRRLMGPNFLAFPPKPLSTLG